MTVIKLRNIRAWLVCESRTLKAIILGYPLLFFAVIFSFLSAGFFALAERYLGYHRLKQLNLHDWQPFDVDLDP